jgi:hypothetical protein
MGVSDWKKDGGRKRKPDERGPAAVGGKRIDYVSIQALNVASVEESMPITFNRAFAEAVPK